MSSAIWPLGIYFSKALPRLLPQTERYIVAANPTIKRTAITRAGYEYQDLAGIDVLIDYFRDADLYEWVQLESCDEPYQSLDDVVALRKDGSVEFVQVKFTVDPKEYFLDWDWLLKAKGEGSSMLSKWMKAFARAKSQGRVHRAQLVTNRAPSDAFATCLDGRFVNLDKVPQAIRLKIDAISGATSAIEFFSEFEFSGAQLDLDRYEASLRDKLVPTDTDSSGWLLLRSFARRWAIHKNDPQPDGKIRREHLIQLITRRRPQPISQDFFVPPGYQVPSQAFDQAVRTRISATGTPITILWATPGRGKSTYLSYLTRGLQQDDEVVLRHHYFLSSDGPRANRMSYSDIAVSIVDQLATRYPEAAAGITGDVEKLHLDLGIAAANLATHGKRLYLVVDGLDHVWRDTARMDQLEFLFNTLLPLPPNVSLIIGTQRVPDAQLPSRLLASSVDADWIEVPRMDEGAVHRWLKAHDNARPLILRSRAGKDRREELAQIGSALFQVSQGHPLHLIYAVEGVVRTGKPVGTEDIEALPPCPDGDIRSYYKALWIRLPVEARNILHALAGSEFFWPDLGIRECLGDFSQIDFLLEPRHAGMIPFHQSIFAYVREMPDHASSYTALLPTIVAWLETKAPEFWRWGWLWLAQAEAGNVRPLFDGANREWVVSSLAAGWPERQIARILSVAERAAFDQGDLPRTVKLRSLKTRVLNAREFQAKDYGGFRATALATNDNRQQALNLIDDLQDLSPDEIVALAKLGPTALRTEVAAACLQELGRRVNAWIELRHKPEHEFQNLSDRLLAAAASSGKAVVPRMLRYLKGYRNPGPHCNTYIDFLGATQDIEALLAVRAHLRGTKASPQRRLIHEHVLRAALFKGANPRPLIKATPSDLTPFTASWLLKSGIEKAVGFHSAPPPADLLRERYSIGANPELSRYFIEFFWTALSVCYQADGEFSFLYPSRDSEKLGWMEAALLCFEDTARGIAAGRISMTYAAIFVAADALDSLDHVGPNDRNGAQYRAFRMCLHDLALDIHLLGLTDPHEPRISEREFELARQTIHWVDEFWIDQNMANQLPLLDKVAAEALIQRASANLANKVSEFMERSDRWTQLARFALIYGLGDPIAIVRRSAECLVGYGWRKDLGASDILDAIQHVHAVNPVKTKEWIGKVTPIIDEITNFTDGDETDHVRSDLIETVSATLPDHLSCFYRRHISQDEWRYADIALEAALGSIDLGSAPAKGLCGTLLDDKMLGILEKRGKTEPEAQVLLQKQHKFLGRTSINVVATEKSSEPLSAEDEAALKQDPTKVPADQFGKLLTLVSGRFPYQHRADFLRRWLDHWKAQGKASVALKSIKDVFDKEERYLNAEEILDRAFAVSLEEEGRDAAYPWLVKAQIYRHGWLQWTSEKEVVDRLTLAAKHYPAKWREFIRDTSEQTPYFKRRGKGFVLGYKHLVRFLLMVGQTDLAIAVTDEFVETLVSEVGDQPIPDARWLQPAGSSGVSLELLFERLNWPVPMVRWRAARAIRNLINDGSTRSASNALLLGRLDACQAEAESAALLTLVFLTDPAARPPLADVASRNHKPSALSDALMHQTYAAPLDPQSWRKAHSGQPPDGFTPDEYFKKYKTSHLPPIFSDNLRRLEAKTRKPFMRQWAFEWKQLRDRIGTTCTEYPYYFDDVTEVRAGIIGQYLQRQNEIYRSAYLRTFAFAVDQWGMPTKLAQGYCLDNLPAIAGLFDLDPVERPLWLTDAPERLLAADTDFETCAKDLIKAGNVDPAKMVSLHAPLRKDASPFGYVSAAAFLVTSDFKPDGEAPPYVPTTVISLAATFDLRGQKTSLSESESVQKGSTGAALPICASLLPVPFGYWHGDYFSVGVRVPANYCLDDDPTINFSNATVDLVSAGVPQATTLMWHDEWSSQYPREGHTRCGTVTMMNSAQLSKVQTKLGLRLGWLVERHEWKREKDYGDYEYVKRTVMIFED